MSTVIPFQNDKPDIHPRAWTGPGSVVIGKVRLEKGVSLWPGAVLRGDLEPIFIGENSNIQDNVSCHTSTDAPLHVGRNVTVGHNAVLHGCRIGDGCLIGMGAVVLDGAELGEGCIVGAGAVVSPGTHVAENTMVLGIPAKPKRILTQEETEEILENARRYSRLVEAYLDHRD